MRRPALLLATTAAMAATPALADVRAGVEAWTRGDYARAIKEWQGPAERGDPDAQFDMAQAYKLGRGVAPDLVKAEQFYRAAAESGHARAADNYGLLLFQSGRQQQAMPWLEQSAERGEPRAQYLVGVAAFNGDFAPRDWVRAYALLTRAAASDLPQALTGLATMNQTIPLDQRQRGIAMANDLQQREARARAIQLGGADLAANGRAAPDPASIHAAAAPTAAASPPPAQPQSLRVAAERATARRAVPAYASEPSRPVIVGADQAGAVTLPPRTARTTPPSVVPASAPPARPSVPPARASAPVAPRPVAASGAWRIQLGAFATKANADALWAKVRARAEIAGHARIDVPGQGITRLQARGFASEAEANRACAALKAGGLACLVVKP